MIDLDQPYAAKFSGGNPSRLRTHWVVPRPLRPVGVDWVSVCGLSPGRWHRWVAVDHDRSPEPRDLVDCRMCWRAMAGDRR